MNINTDPILIIDDDAFQRRMIRIKLQTRGYEANEAKDGVEALAFLAEQSYSLVLLDIVMPQLNGWEVLDQIRTDFSTDQLPVIMMTAKDNSYDPEAAKKRGATDYLTKPIDFPSLDQRIDEYINGVTADDNAGATVADAAAEPDGDEPAPQDTPQEQQATAKVSPDKPVHSLLDGMVRNLPGVFFRAIADTEHNVQLSFESNGLHDFLGQSWSGVQEIFANLENHDRREVNRQFRDHSADVQSIQLRFPCRTTSGKTGWVECRATPHRLPSGETVWDAMLLDVSEQKELELQAIRAREAAEKNPAPEFLPLLEMYRRFHTAVGDGIETDELSKSIAELEEALAETAVTEKTSDTQKRRTFMPDADYRDENGFIHQCAQCRKVQNFEDERWELVAEWTHKMPLKTSHTICADCAEADELLTS